MMKCAEFHHEVKENETSCPTCFSEDIGPVCESCDAVMVMRGEYTICQSCVLAECGVFV